MAKQETTFRAIVAADRDGRIEPRLEIRSVRDLPDGEVTIAVDYSALNYKDMLSAYGNTGVTRNYPHVPGIDAAGTVIESSGQAFSRGDAVFVTGHDLGMNTSGGLSERIRVPESWCLAIPAGLDAWEMMAAGTAGFTSAQSVHRVANHPGIEPGATVLVTGSGGAVGSHAVSLLSHLGYAVSAATTRAESTEHVAYLKSIGAGEIVPATELGQPDRPMVRARWDAVIDCVGGAPLAAAIAALSYRGCATTCGMVAGSDLATSIFPFILRGVTLYGIDSAECPNSHRKELWQLLGSDWRLPRATLEKLCKTVSLDEVPEQLAALKKGGTRGHTVVRITEGDES
jgi:putative YhdH/YhfP family quinone oxidoreductase